ncbi:MAG: response regulator [Anaerolineaceae bacterium]|nr:response regulator [Anaerolineaceae bacterium]NTV37435.1 response regulator [Anaerolineaceae bacterium]
MSKTCILVIEDNIDNLDLIRFLLEQEGYEILTAMDGKNGLKICEEQKPDMVLLDLTLPEIDGWHLASRLKKSPETASIRVIAITAHVLPGDRERAFEAGCDGYITKPLDINNFPVTIKEYLSSK